MRVLASTRSGAQKSPRLVQKHLQLAPPDGRKLDADGGIALVVVRNEEGLRVGLQECVAGVEVDPDGERGRVLAQPEEELAGDLEGRRPVRGAFDDARERQREPSRDGEGHSALADRRARHHFAEAFLISASAFGLLLYASA